LFLYAALGGALFFLAFNLVGVQGYPATAAGAALLPFSILLAGLSRWAGGLVERHGARLPLTAGPVIAAAGFAVMALPGVVFLAVFDAGLTGRLDGLGLPPELCAAAQAAYLGVFRAVTLTTAALALAGGICAWGMISGPDGRRPDQGRAG
jgi:hypothetical protein